jgi:hypothetical protein
MSSPTVPFETQNVHDDDGQVIDSFFIETDTPPNLKDATEPIPPSDSNTVPPKVTRLLTRSLIVQPGWDAVQLFPSDANRRGFYLRVTSPTAVATDGIRLADNNGEVRTAGQIFHGQTTSGSAFDEHTGAVHIISTNATDGGNASAPVVVAAWAVTV